MRVHCLRNVVKQRHASGVAFRLEIPELDIARGDRIACVGASGSGKSTLLDLLALALEPSAADCFSFTPPDVAAVDLRGLWQSRDLDRLAALRRHYIGYVLQTGGLLPFLTVRENIELPCRLLRICEDDTALELASRLGIANQLRKRPGELSVGERQRVAVARALAHRPAVVLADEPTASVDPVAATSIMSLMLELADQLGITAVIASHDWPRLEALGLRRLGHELSREHADGVTVSRFWG